MGKPTVNDILYAWLKRRQIRGMREVTNHDMQQVQLFGKDEYGKLHNVATYERAFRKIREQYPYRFKDVSNRYPGRAEKTWLILKRKKEKV